jgi:hypothetical protein
MSPWTVYGPVACLHPHQTAQTQNTIQCLESDSKPRSQISAVENTPRLQTARSHLQIRLWTFRNVEVFPLVSCSVRLPLRALLGSEAFMYTAHNEKSAGDLVGRP